MRNDGGLWGSDDHQGHGTQLAGVCLFGPLGEPLYGNHPVELRHRLESVKILPRDGRNEPPDYGPITLGAMALAESAAPNQQRVFCLAVTAEGDDHWRPTLWSAALDQACAGTMDGYRRLVLVSAGNLREDVGKNYPTENYVSSVENPAQSWNALTVGAYTNLAWIAEQGLEGYTPIAKPGTLSRDVPAFADQFVKRFHLFPGLGWDKKLEIPKLFGQWLEGLADWRAQARISARLIRLHNGNFGDCKPVGEGVWELRIDTGPGYRVYYARAGERLILLLVGGDKRRQQADIEPLWITGKTGNGGTHESIPSP